MRDASAAYWFSVGDTVEVVEDVWKSQHYNLRGRIGVVRETWEKCDVDPTCCCAEQVDPNMAVRVEFAGTESNPHEPESSFLFYFGEQELCRVVDNIQKKKEEEEEEDPTGEEEEESVVVEQLPFDGMSCKAFKLEQLEAQRNAAAAAAKESNKD